MASQPVFSGHSFLKIFSLIFFLKKDLSEDYWNLSCPVTFLSPYSPLLSAMFTLQVKPSFLFAMFFLLDFYVSIGRAILHLWSQFGFHFSFFLSLESNFNTFYCIILSTSVCVCVCIVDIRVCVCVCVYSHRSMNFNKYID